MDSIVDSIDSAYQEFVNEISNFLETKQNDGGKRSVASDLALQNLTHKWESFKVACDQADEFVNYTKQRIAGKCEVDEATYERTVHEFLVDGGGFESGDLIDENLNENIMHEFQEDDGSVSVEKSRVEDDKSIQEIGDLWPPKV
ncbi:hypothetical protein RD792_016305 [Penstemon davidsonii]|uniref:Uncharacterized protein n=1 Tax=Penstemon davidsonii TaxID=160366 RepID=A0ABR0CJF0_9LAMI|nr:hypothetical protein RD792_016305 [Penstemon davidsonii]